MGFHYNGLKLSPTDCRFEQVCDQLVFYDIAKTDECPEIENLCHLEPATR